MARSRARRATKPIEQSGVTKSRCTEERPIFFLKTRVAMQLLTCLGISLVMSFAPGLAQTAIPLDDLPAPPAELKRLIETGSVTFQTGAAKEETDRRDPGTNIEPTRKYAAETHYRIRFDYDAQISWRIIARRKEVRITAKLRRFGWQPSHTVWFRDRPETKDFWSNPLVLHEFDHVRLSTDPRMKARFEQLLNEPIVIRHQLASEEIINQQLARRLVDEHLQGMQQEVLELIGIRYRELDQATSHGGAPLTEDSRLYEWLREMPSATVVR